MKRRDFIKKASIATAGALAAPYILPTGRLFASTGGIPIANHVVLVMFAGGVRHQESIGQGYLKRSQYDYALPAAQAELNFEGNIMNNMLEGPSPSALYSTPKIIYGYKNPANYGISGASYTVPFPAILSQSLQKQGTIFKYADASNPGHYGGLNVMLQGGNAASQGLRQKPLRPTIFEYLRRHGGPVDFPASKVWMVGNGIGNSIPLLNHSEHPRYGAQYGANFFAPTVTFGGDGDKYLKNAKIYHPQEELDPMYEMKYFLDNSFANIGNSLPNIGNTDDEKQQIKEFMRSIFNRKAGTGAPLAYPTNLDPDDRNGDINTISYACEILREFKPKLLVVNMSNVDTAHGNFSGYLRNLHRADYAVGHIWDFINSDPTLAGTNSAGGPMKNETAIIVAPECGRNAAPNAIKDLSALRGYDHSDANTGKVFCLMAGKGIAQNTIYNEVNASLNGPGELAPKELPGTGDIALTIAEILGLKSDVLNANLITYKKSLFDKM